jgi:hypothetical protein
MTGRLLEVETLDRAGIEALEAETVRSPA